MYATKRSLIIGILFLAIFTSTSFAQTQEPDKPDATARYTQRENYIVRAYLTGEGVPSVMAFAAAGKDLLSLLQNLQKRQPSATLIIESVKYVAKDGSISTVKDLPYPFNKNVDSLKIGSPAIQEINQLKTYSFVSGVIYFKGAGFTNVLPVQASNTAELYKQYDRCVPGTSIILDGCVYKQADGTLSTPMSKTIQLK